MSILSPPTTETIDRMKAIGTEVGLEMRQQSFEPVHTPLDQRPIVLQKLRDVVEQLTKAGKALARFYTGTLDEARVRSYFRSVGVPEPYASLAPLMLTFGIALPPSGAAQG